MEQSEAAKYRDKMIRIYQEADLICQKHPEADRGIVVQSLLMRDDPPMEKIRFALMRGAVLKKSKKC